MYSLILFTLNWLAIWSVYASTLLGNLGGPGVLVLAMGDSSFFSVPEGNDLLIVILSAGQTWSHMAYFVGMTIIGSVLGCLMLYWLGRKGGDPILRRRFSLKNIERAEKLFARYGILTIVISSLLPPPTPFKIFVLSAGVFHQKALEFFTGVLIGRTMRYSMWGILAVLYGNSVKHYMQQHLDSMGIVLFVGFVLAVGVMLALYPRRLGSIGSGKAS